MKRNVDLIDRLGLMHSPENDVASLACASFAACFAFMRDAQFYAAKRQGDPWHFMFGGEKHLHTILRSKRLRYRGYVRHDIAFAMECLHLALDALIAANPWIVGGAA